LSDTNLEIKNLAYKIINLIVKYSRILVRLNRGFIIEIIEAIKVYSYEKRLNIQTGLIYCFKDVFSLRKDDEYPYEPTSYYDLEKIVNYLKLKPEDVLVDFGCGKGRTVFYVALQNVRKVIGVELNKELINIAHRNLANIKFSKAAIKLICSDAVNFEINDENIFFMFNPFGYEKFKKVIENIKNSLVNNPRQIRIVYYIPRYSDLLKRQNWLTLEAELNDGRCLIWRNKF